LAISRDAVREDYGDRKGTRNQGNYRALRFGEAAMGTSRGRMETLSGLRSPLVVTRITGSKLCRKAVESLSLMVFLRSFLPPELNSELF
jgi:hypothetical protein